MKAENMKESRGFLRKCAEKLTNAVNHSLRRKFIVSASLLFLVTFTLFGVITYERTKSVIENNVRLLTLQNLMLVSRHIDLYLQETYADSRIYGSDSQFIEMMREIEKVSPPQDDAIEICVQENGNYPNISQHIRSSAPKISGTYYLNRNGIYNIHPTGIYYVSPNRFADRPWFIKLMANESDFIFFADAPEGSGLNMAVPLKDAGTRNTVRGVMLFELNYDNVIRNITPELNKSYPQGGLLLTDIFGSDIYRDLTGDYPELPEGQEEEALALQTRKFMGQDYYYISHMSSLTAIKITQVIPAQSVLGDVRKLKNTMALLAGITLLIIALLLSGLSELLLRPIHQLAQAMTRIKEESFQTRIQLKTADETKLLADSFNGMAEDIERMINEVYLSSLKQKEAEILALQSQINPHFLYNTLDSIWGACLSGNSPHIATMIKSLSQIFRYNTNRAPTVRLNEEIRHIRNYMKIQNFRYDNLYRIHCKISDDLQECTIPRLTIQPLVENAIHSSPGEGEPYAEVSICAEARDGKVKIAVIDNGKGISEAEMERLNRSLQEEWRLPEGERNPEEGGTGVGLKNVNARIKLLFGEQYGLQFKAAARGTRVEISIPSIKEVRKHESIGSG
jgi:two-component system sensor histidine kinase YesM